MKVLKKVAWLIFKYLLIIFSLIVIYATKIEPNWIEVKKQPVYIAELPAAFDGFRIVQLSDLHGKTFSDGYLVQSINSLSPDLVVITGDVFDQGKKTPVEYVENVLKGIESKFGAYFVFGNNDTYLDKRTVKEQLDKVKIKTLLNERVCLTIDGQSIDLVGLDDPYSQNADLPGALEGARQGVKILLVHTPEYVYLAARAGINLILAGHTHGGQFLLPFPPYRIANMSKGYEKFLSGLHRVDNCQMYVNRGLGEKGVNVRFLTRPEITVITLYNKHNMLTK